MTEAGIGKYVYTPLQSPQHIRLVHFRRELRQDGTIMATLCLCQHHIRELPQYTAVSYTWGCPTNDSDAPQPEWEDEQCFVLIEGASLSIRKNIMTLIRKLASNPRDYLWIDAICIDQLNRDEQAAQVTLMAQIYSEAEEVLVWMGEDEEAPNILQATKDLWAAIYKGTPAREATEVSHWMMTHNPNMIDTIEACNMTPERWRDAWTKYFRLFDRYTWFHRAWVLQEVQQARKIQWWCHDQYGDLNLLLEFALDLHRSEWLSQLQMGHGTSPNHNPAIVIQSLRNITPGFRGTWARFASLIYGAVTDDQRRFAYLLYIVQQFRASNATRPADKIYSTLSIAATGAAVLPDGWPIPDYHKPDAHIFLEVTSAMLTKLPVMAVLSLVEPREEHGLHGLPSWVPDFTIPLCYRPLMHMGASLSDDEIPDRADTQVGGLYNASLADSGDLKYMPAINDDKLFLTGASIDLIEEVLKIDLDSDSGLISLLFFCSDLPERDPRSGQSRKDVLCRTMVADRYGTYPAPQSICFKWDLLIAQHLSLLQYGCTSQDSQMALTRIMKYFNEQAPDVLPEQELLQRMNHDLQLMLDLDSGDTPERSDAIERLYLVRQTVERFKGVIKYTTSGRVLCRTSRGHVGFTHHDVIPGDSVWLLQGGRSLYTLREQGTGKHVFRGEAYLHGFMQGEALTPEFCTQLKPVCLI